MIRPTKEKAVLAVYSSGDGVRTILIFLGWIVFLGGGIWLLINLFRSRNLPNWAKGILLVVVVIFPPLGIGVCLVVWFVMRSRSRTAEAEAPGVPAATSKPPSANEALQARRRPFPPHPGSATAPASGSETPPEPQLRG
jgi:hypothetical protein